MREMSIISTLSKSPFTPMSSFDGAGVSTFRTRHYYTPATAIQRLQLPCQAGPSFSLPILLNMLDMLDSLHLFTSEK
jgi:hypothetical protein